jgi:hypothetical protein
MNAGQEIGSLGFFALMYLAFVRLIPVVSMHEVRKLVDEERRTAAAVVRIIDGGGKIFEPVGNSRRPCVHVPLMNMLSRIRLPRCSKISLIVSSGNGAS